MDGPHGRALLLRIYVGETDKAGHEALYKHLVKLLRERGVAGATAFRGVMGYGARSVLHATSPLRLSQDLPIVIEAVDEPAKIEAVLPEVTALVAEGLVLTEEVRIHRRDPGRPSR
jgi:PII-like signaling protein